MNIENLTNDLKIVLEAIKNGDNKDAESILKEILQDVEKYSFLV